MQISRSKVEKSVFFLSDPADLNFSNSHKKERECPLATQSTPPHAHFKGDITSSTWIVFIYTGLRHESQHFRGTRFQTWCITSTGTPSLLSLSCMKMSLVSVLISLSLQHRDRMFSTQPRTRTLTHTHIGGDWMADTKDDQVTPRFIAIENENETFVKRKKSTHV